MPEALSGPHSDEHRRARGLRAGCATAERDFDLPRQVHRVAYSSDVQTQAQWPVGNQPSVELRASIPRALRTPAVGESHDWLTR